MKFPPEIEKVLHQAGLSETSLDRVRLSRGVVGKSAYVAAGALLVLAVAGYSLRDSGLLMLVAVLAFAIFVVFFVGSLVFAHKNPGIALLEGAELIQWRQMDMAAKSVPAGVQISEAENVLIGSGQAKE